jgi:hypothetical protein
MRMIGKQGRWSDCVECEGFVASQSFPHRHWVGGAIASSAQGL